MEYFCLSQQFFIHSPNLYLTPIRQQDMEKIRKWRNEQIQILRQKKILSKQEQEHYFKEKIHPSFSLQNPEQILFSYILNENCIGYGGLVHIDWQARRAEVSFLLQTGKSKKPSQYRSLFLIFLQLLRNIAFEYLFLHRIYTETFDIRPDHIKTLEQAGFLFEGRLKEHHYFENEGIYVDSLLHGMVNHAHT